MTDVKVQVGDFIEVPAWRTAGMVQHVKGSMFGSSDSVTVLLQEHPEQPARDWKSYRLEPEEFEIV